MKIGNKQYTFFTWGVIWRSALLLLVLLFIIFFLLAGTVARVFDEQEYAENTTVPVQERLRENQDFNLLLAQVDSFSEAKRLLYCNANGCEQVQAPEGAGVDALFDGESWYYYETVQDGGQEYIRLQKSGVTDLPQTIMEETDLVRPRSLAMSPDGSKVAYWLDNIADDEGLTELWIYDAVSGGTRVIAEKLVKESVLSKLQWNKAGTLLWFIADSGKEEEKLELVVAQVQPAQVSAKFLNVNWDGFALAPDQHRVDISADGSRLAASRPQTSEISELILANNDGATSERKVRGVIPYVEWINDGRLFYTIESAAQEVQMWQFDDSGHEMIARLPGRLRGATASSDGSHIAMVISNIAGSFESIILNTETAELRSQAPVPRYGTDVHLVQVVPNQLSAGNVAGISTELSDGEIIAFVEQHRDEITTSSDPLVRLLTTNEQNGVLLDVKKPDDSFERLYIIIRDAVHPEWEVVGRYIQVGAGWQRTQGDGSDPEPQNLYEWEVDLDKWILKTSY